MAGRSLTARSIPALPARESPRLALGRVPGNALSAQGCSGPWAMGREGHPGGWCATPVRLSSGRDAELKALDEALEAVETAAKTRIVTLVGPAGIGKSRLIQDFVLQHRRRAPLSPRVYRGSASRRGDGLRPLRAGSSARASASSRAWMRRPRRPRCAPRSPPSSRIARSATSSISSASSSASPSTRARSPAPSPTIRSKAKSCAARCSRPSSKPTPRTAPICLVFEDLHARARRLARAAPLPARVPLGPDPGRLLCAPRAPRAARGLGARRRAAPPGHRAPVAAATTTPPR